MTQFLFYLFIALSITGCSAQLQKSENDSSTITRRDLFRTARENQTLIVYGAQLKKYKAKYQKISEQIAASSSRRKILVKADTEVDTTDLTENVIVLVGTPQSNRFIKGFAEKLPLSFQDSSFTFSRKVYADSTDIIALPIYPNPLNPALPISLLTGNQDAALVDLYGKDPEASLWSRWGYSIFHEQQPIVMGEFSDSLWQVNPSTHFDFTGHAEQVLETPHFKLITHQLEIPEVEIEQIAAKREEIYTRVKSFTGADFSHKIAYHLYPSSETKGLLTGNTDQSYIEPEVQAVHTIWNQEYADNDIAMEAKLMVNAALGTPKLHAMEDGLAISFSETWQKKGYEFWALRLYQSGNLPALADLLDNGLYAQESYLLNGCASATLVNFLVKSWGKEKFLKEYKQWQPSPNEMNRIELGWHAYLEEQAKQLETEKPANFAEPVAFYKGFNFTQEGFQIYDGYNSHKATQSIKKIHELGGNAVAIVPYSFMPGPDQPSYLPINRSAHGENDEGVIHSSFVAHQDGMETMLKPQIWVRGAWPGEIMMQSEADWQAFLGYYYRWIRHYALLAEIHQVDIFCVGVELSQVTLTHEKEFCDMIRKIRKLYSGKLVYAPNWGEEFEKISLWNDLDYIAINCYYPLSDKEDPSERQLINNFEKVLDKIEKVVDQYQKPVLFTEIGFRSIEAPWRTPHAEAGEAASSIECQAKSYETVFKCLQNKDWCHGIFWWQWPSTMTDTHPTDRSFSPCNKKTEQVIASWFPKFP